MGWYLAGLLVAAMICGAIGGTISDARGHSVKLGFWAGFVLGPFGFLLLLLTARSPEVEGRYQAKVRAVIRRIEREAKDA